MKCLLCGFENEDESSFYLFQYYNRPICWQCFGEIGKEYLKYEVLE